MVLTIAIGGQIDTNEQDEECLLKNKRIQKIVFGWYSKIQKISKFALLFRIAEFDSLNSCTNDIMSTFCHDETLERSLLINWI